MVNQEFVFTILTVQEAVAFATAAYLFVQLPTSKWYHYVAKSMLAFAVIISFFVMAALGEMFGL